MFRSLGWQPLLLVVAFLLAISLAAVGWLLGRSRSRMQFEEDRAGSITDPIASNDASRPPTVKPTAAPDASGVITFDLSLATRAGELKTTEVDGQAALIGWSSPNDTATWQFQAARSGFYRAELTYATASEAAEAELELRIDDRKRRCSLRASGGLDRFISDEYPVAVPVSGRHQLVIQPHGDWNADWLLLRGVRLIPMSGDKPRAGP
jgi:hypothetical protein